MSKEPKAARAAPAEEPMVDPALVLGDAAPRSDGPPPVINIARANGGVWIDIVVEQERQRVLEELFNVALGRSPDNTRALIDQSSATPKVTKVREAAQRMAQRLGVRGFEIIRRV